MLQDEDEDRGMNSSLIEEDFRKGDIQKSEYIEEKQSIAESQDE